MRPTCGIVTLFRIHTSAFATTGSGNRRRLETGIVNFWVEGLWEYFGQQIVVIRKEMQGRDHSYSFLLHANSSEFCTKHFACLRKLYSLPPKFPNKPGVEHSWMHQAGTRKLCEWKFPVVDASRCKALGHTFEFQTMQFLGQKGKFPTEGYLLTIFK